MWNRARHVVLVLATLLLALMLTVSGFAQDATPSPTEDLKPTEAATDAPETPEIAETPEITETPEVDETPEVEEIPEADETPGAGDAEPGEGEDASPAPDSTEATGVTGEGAQDLGIEITVYNQDLGLVKEVRGFALEQGENEVRYTDVASRIDPTSVHVSSLTDPAGTVVLEQNYQYDLVSTSKLLQRYIDRDIRVRTQQGESYTGTLLSGARDVILATEQGVQVISLSQIEEYSFPELPDGLITRPTLVWLLRAGEDGEQNLRVTYLTGGISWHADYIALLAPDDASLSLNGWISVNNRSGATYENAKLKVVAGDISRVAQPDMVREEFLAKAAMPGAPAPQVVERQFFEYHLYDVQRPVTLRDNETKQIEFISAPSVNVTKTYVYAGAPSIAPRPGLVLTEPDYGVGATQKVAVYIEIANSEESGLGLPLPKGTIRVYKEDIDGSAELVGENVIDHTPKGEDMSIYLGDAFDVLGERKQISYRKIGERTVEEGIQIELRNRKDEDITVRVIERLYRAQDAEIVEINVDYEMLDATTLRADVPVEAGGASMVTYTVRYTW